MDNEDLEQIPWSSLVADKSQGVDQRIYIAVGVVGVVVALIFGARIFGGSQAQPSPPLDVAPEALVESVETTTSAGLVISEADLMAVNTAYDPQSEFLRVAAFAEWFVTDYFTMDGSTETERSLRALLSRSTATTALPHTASPEAATTYVEWARSVGLRIDADDQAEVEVVFRTITETADGFIRDPIAAVSVVLRFGPVDPGVVGPPVSIPVPTLNAAATDSASAADGDG